MDKFIFSIDKDEPGTVRVEILETINGIKKVTKQRLAFNDFVEVLQNSTDSSDRIKIGAMPNGFYDGYIDADGNGLQCLIVLPAGIKPFVYYDKAYSIPYPALIFSLRARKGKLVESFVYALKEDKVSSHTALYYYPFGNVYDDGRICWGSNNIKGITSLRSTETVISSFFGCSTNDDMWNNGKNIVVSKDDTRILQRGLVESLVDTETFPKEIMVKHGKTVADLMK